MALTYLAAGLLVRVRMTDKRTPEEVPETITSLLWEGKWWILLIALGCGAFAAAIVALIQLQPKRSKAALRDVEEVIARVDAPRRRAVMVALS